MPRRLRIALLAVGIALAAVSLAALIYAGSPAERVHEEQSIPAAQMAP